MRVLVAALTRGRHVVQAVGVDFGWQPHVMQVAHNGSDVASNKDERVVFMA